MKFTSAVALGALAAPAVALKAKVTPTQQVINMLTKMKEKGTKMMNKEEKTFFYYTEWADDEVTKLGFEIKDGAARIEELVAYIDKAESDVAKASSQIEALDAEIDKLSAERAEATKIRKAENAEYQKLSTDYAESVDALVRAIEQMKAQDFDRKQAESLLQRMSTTVRGMPRVLEAFLMESSKSGMSGNGAPEVAAYEFQSGGIVSMLEGLLKKFKGELDDTEEAESNSLHAYQLLEMHLSDTIAKDESDREEKKSFRGRRASESAKAKGELAETRKDKKEDERLKAETQTTYDEKKAIYEVNQKTRKAELEAISKAVEIMSSPEVSDSYSKHVNLVQKATSLIQLRSRKRRVAGGQRVSEFLTKRAKALDSKTLASFADEISAGAPFTKIIGMIEDLIAKLKKEAEAEAEHKKWCDEQLKENKLKRNKKTAHVEDLTSQIEGKSADIADMGARIEKLLKEQAELTKAMEEATDVRNEDKAENLATIADSKAGQKAVKKAIEILTEFYSSQASLLQQVPEMEAYKGMQTSNKGVIGMLEVVLTDFARLQTETEQAEHDAAVEYDVFMKMSERSKKMKHEEEYQLSLDKDQAEYEKRELEKDLADVQKELDRANEYFEYLKPSCLEVHVSYEERVARRKEEIEALKEAYGILDQK